MVNSLNVSARFRFELRRSGLKIVVLGMHLAVVWMLLAPAKWPRAERRVKAVHPVTVTLLRSEPVAAAQTPARPVARRPAPQPNVRVAQAQAAAPAPPAPTPPAPPALPALQAEEAPTPPQLPAPAPSASPPVAVLPAPPQETRVAAAAPPPPPKLPLLTTQVAYRVPPPAEVPRLSRRAGEQGAACLRVRVDAQGAPREVAVLRSSGFARLDEQALWAMQRARFVPFTENGTPFEVEVHACIEYRLD
jgi:protein TonB